MNKLTAILAVATVTVLGQQATLEPQIVKLSGTDSPLQSFLTSGDFKQTVLQNMPTGKPISQWTPVDLDNYFEHDDWFDGWMARENQESVTKPASMSQWWTQQQQGWTVDKSKQELQEF